jgi:hypothetical protein
MAPARGLRCQSYSAGYTPLGARKSTQDDSNTPVSELEKRLALSYVISEVECRCRPYTRQAPPSP